MRGAVIAALVCALLSPGGAWAAKKKKKKSEFPEVSVESKEEKAARMWQSGTLSSTKGDYEEAVGYFERCVRTDPKNADCKKALKEAKENLKLNPPRHKKRKPKPKPKPAEAAAGAPDTEKTGGTP